MHHEVVAPQAGTVDEVLAAVGSAVVVGERLIILDESVRPDGEVPGDAPGAAVGPSDGAAGEHVAVAERADLAEVVERHERSGSTRPGRTAVERRRQRRATHGSRERRRPRRRRLVRRVRAAGDRRAAPAALARRPDRAHARPTAWSAASARSTATCSSGQRRRQVVAMSYDYTVLAGTQGTQNHRKKDRLFELAEQLRLPIVFFTEGGGGRPGDTDGIGVSGLDCLAFRLVRPSCRARAARRHQRRLLLRRQRGDPRLLRRRDRHRGLEHRHGRPGDDRGRRARRVRADGDRPDRACSGPTASSTSWSPTRPRRSPSPSSTCRTSRAAIADVGVRRPDASCATSIPEDRLAQLRRAHARSTRCSTPARCSSCAATSALGMVTALARVEGRPVGVVANNPTHLAGAIDCRRRRQGGPVHAAVRRVRPPDRHARRHAGDDGRPGRRGDRARAPLQPAVRHRRQRHRAAWSSIVLRKAYGLGAQAMMGGSDEGAAGVRGLADRRVRRHGPGGRGAPRLPQGARGRSRTRTSARRCSRRWSTGCTSTARR